MFATKVTGAMRAYPPLLRPLAVALALGLAGPLGACGDDDGGGPKTFDEKGFEITFTYPGDFDLVDKLTFNRSAGSSATASKGVGLDKENLIAIQRFDLRLAVTKKSLDRVRPEADGLFSQLAGGRIKGKEVEVGGLPGFQYEIGLQEPKDGRTRATLLFDQKVEYLMNCQSTPEEREEIAKACAQALRTLRPK